MVISAEKSDIVKYFAERDYAAEIFYVVQQQPRGLCDALFRAEPFVRDDQAVLIGLPDTIWFPENAYTPAINQNADINLVLFPVLNPAVVRCGGLRRTRLRGARGSEASGRALALDMGRGHRPRKRLQVAQAVVGRAPSRRRIPGPFAECLHGGRQRRARHVLRRALHGCGNARRLSRGTGLPARTEASRPHSGGLTLTRRPGDQSRRSKILNLKALSSIKTSFHNERTLT